MTYIPPPNPNGPATPSGSSPVVLSALSVGGTVKTTPALGYEFLTDSAGGWFDTLGYTWISITVVGASTTTGEITFRSTENTAALASSLMSMQDSALIPVSRTTAFGLNGTFTRHFEGPITARYIQMILTQPVPNGTVVLTAVLRNATPLPSVQTIALADPLPAGTNNFASATLTTPNAADVTVAISTLTGTQPAVYTDVVTTTGALAPDLSSLSAPPATCFIVRVTSVSGTNPAVDVVVQESIDGGNYYDVYHFERITAVGTFVSPLIRIIGPYARFVRTVSGTTPSFGMSLYRNNKSIQGNNYRSFYDRTINPNTLNSTSPTYFADGSHRLHIAILSTAATTPAVIALQGSQDRINWFTIFSVTTLAVGIREGFTISYGAKWVRIITTTAGTAQTFSYVHINAYGP